MEPITLTYEQLANYLESKAANRQTVHYNDLASELGLPPVNNRFAAHPLKQYFEQIDCQDANEQKPFRTALVVQKQTERPGTGFFKSLAHHRKQKLDPAKHEEIWQHEIADLFHYYDPTRTKTSITIELSHTNNDRLNRLCEKSSLDPVRLLEQTLSKLLDELEYEAAIIAHADADHETGRVFTSEEVWASLRRKFAKMPRTVRITAPTARQLEKLAKQRKTSVNKLAKNVIDSYLSHEKRIAKLVEEGRAAGNRGEMLDHEEVMAMMDKIIQGT